MKRRNLLTQIGATVAGISFVSAGNTAGNNNRHEAGDPTLDTEFRPSSYQQVSRFVVNTMQRVEQLQDTRNVQQLEDKIDSLDRKQQSAIGKFITDEMELLICTDQSVRVEDTTLIQGQRATFENTIEAVIDVPYCSRQFGCASMTFDAFTFTQKLQWFYDGSTVENPSVSTSHTDEYYGVVGWDFEGISDDWVNYHPDDLYIESYTEGKFNRIAFSNYVETRTDYGSMHLVGHNNAHGHVADENVY